MSARPCLSWEGSAVAEDSDDWIGLSCVVARLKSLGTFVIMVYELVSLQLMRPTHESCSPIYLFGLHLQISSTMDDIPFSEQEDEENIGLSLTTSLEAGAIPRLYGDPILVYLTTQLAKVMAGLQLEHQLPVPGNPP